MKKIEEGWVEQKERHRKRDSSKKTFTTRIVPCRGHLGLVPEYRKEETNEIYCRKKKVTLC